MARVLLGVTGSVAAIKTPIVYHALKLAGHEVKLVATKAATYFFDPAQIDSVNGTRNRDTVYLDEDEWPGREEGSFYQRQDIVLHIELRRWAELLLIAPLDANTLAKLACGLCDNCLTCVFRAWDPSKPMVLAPAMNTLMWEHPLTARHLRQLAEVFGIIAPATTDLEALPEWINAHCPRLRIVGPISKQLACGDVGVGAMAEAEAIVKMIGGFRFDEGQ